MFRVEENGQFRGTVTFLDLKPNAGCIENQHVAADAAIEATKLKHQHRVAIAQESATTVTDETKTVHVVKGTTGTLKTIKAGCVVPCVGGDTITIDLLKAGVSVLTAKITLTSSQSAYALLAGTIDTAALAADDVLEIEIDAVAAGGTMGKGVFVYVDLHEDVD